MASASGLRHRHVNLLRSRRCALVTRAFGWDPGSLRRLSLQFRIVYTVHVRTCIDSYGATWLPAGVVARSEEPCAFLCFFFLYLGQVLFFKKGDADDIVTLHYTCLKYENSDLVVFSGYNSRHLPPLPPVTGPGERLHVLASAQVSYLCSAIFTQKRKYSYSSILQHAFPFPLALVGPASAPRVYSWATQPGCSSFYF